MASNRDRDDPLSYTNPSSSSSPITVSDPLDSYLTDPNSHIGSASGSFQNEGLLADTGSSYNDAEFGFSRPEFRQNLLVGTVDYYERHVFLCYKNPKVWPPRIEAAEFDRLPRLLSAAVTARKGDMKKETQLTICEGHDGSETSNGDVLIFPDMVRYRRLTHFDVDTFVEEVLVKNGEWMPGMPETLKGSYIFVCSHGSRDRRCGVCGPALVCRFKEEIEVQSLGGKVSVSSCSHIGGHKYAGNVIIFGSNLHGEVTGHWYGYVSPDDVTGLLEQHIGKGEILDQLWRGQMGLSEEQQRKVQELRLGMNGMVKVSSRKMLEQTDGKEPVNFPGRSQIDNLACCQENGNATCCQSPALADEKVNLVVIEMAKTGRAEKKRSTQKLLSRLNSGKAASPHKVCSMPAWYESWQREDTYAALAVICAAASVGVAFSLYKQMK